MAMGSGRRRDVPASQRDVPARRTDLSSRRRDLPARRLPIDCPAGGTAPGVWLLDARTAELDEAALRAGARSIAAETGKPRTSRSYRHPLALVAAHDGPVGVDVERIDAVDGRLTAVICTPDELALLPDSRSERASTWLARLWSGKEALAKALGDARAYEPARLSSPLLWPDGRAGAWRAAELTLPDGWVGWVCWSEPDDD